MNDRDGGVKGYAEVRPRRAPALARLGHAPEKTASVPFHSSPLPSSPLLFSARAMQSLRCRGASATICRASCRRRVKTLVGCRPTNNADSSRDEYGRGAKGQSRDSYQFQRRELVAVPVLRPGFAADYTAISGRKRSPSRIFSFVVLPYHDCASSMARVALTRLVQHSQHRTHSFLKGREISRNDEPDRLKVHFKVVVHQNVAHGGYRWPVDLTVPLFERLANPLRRLAEYLKIANDCVPARWGFTAAQLPAERRHGSKDSTSVESPPVHAGPGVARDRRSYSPETRAWYRR